MSARSIKSLATVFTLGAALAVPLIAAGDAGAVVVPSHVWVSPSGNGSGGSCANADYSSIQDAVDAVATWGTVTVCTGAYQESVNVTRSMTLQGRGATIQVPFGAPYGIGIGADWVTVRGFAVLNAAPLDAENGALADGIVTAAFTPGPHAGNYATIENNIVSGNLGSGIDLNSTSFSVARNNTASGNGVGINVSDDLGLPAAYNTIANNVTDQNFGGCGIALADHTGAGIIGNKVSGNESNDNGLGTPTAPDASAGSGVILAGATPGSTVRDNVISNNSFARNGHGGVVVHSHVPNIPFGPQIDFSGNVINGNTILTNNLRTDTSDPATTGIYLGSASPLRIRVSNNVIRSNHYGIFTAGQVTLKGGGNQFIADAVNIGGVPTYGGGPL